MGNSSASEDHSQCHRQYKSDDLYIRQYELPVHHFVPWPNVKWWGNVEVIGAYEREHQDDEYGCTNLPEQTVAELLHVCLHTLSICLPIDARQSGCGKLRCLNAGYLDVLTLII